MPNFNIPEPPTIPTSPNPFSNVEILQLAEIFNSPLVKKYLQYLTWNTIIDSASIPLPETPEQITAHAIRSAFSKGALNILYTLNNIDKPAPQNVQQQGREPR